LARYKPDVWAGSSGNLDDWTDSGPLGLTLTHTTSPNRPTPSVAPNGRGAIDFNATYIDNDPIVVTSDKLAAFVATSMGSSTVNFARLISVATSDVTNDFDNTSSAALFCREASTQAITSYRVSDKGPLAIPAYDQLFVGSVVYNGATCTLGVNGTYSTPSASTGAFNIGYMRVGATMTVSTEYWRGKVCEIILISGTLSEDNARRLEGYLAHTYGIALAASHPYANHPPLIGENHSFDKIGVMRPSVRRRLAIPTYDEALRQGRLWTPKVWKGDAKLAAWYDFSNENGGLTVATGLSSAVDLSGNGQTVTQATGVAQPAYSATGWTGGTKPAITPDGNDGMEMASGLSYNGTTGFSFACIAYNDGAGLASFFGHYGSGGGCAARFENDILVLTRSFQAYLLQTSAGTCPAGVRIVGGDFQTNYTAGWIDGVSYSNSNDPAFVVPVLSLFNDNGSALFSGGPVGEIMFGQSRWTVRDRTLVDGYLAWKWGHVSNLAASHPYKNRPPLIGD
jgi:hypothetical protein